MNIIGALTLFLVFILVYILIIEVFTVLFRLTGLTPDKAKFQVISMLTNSGFTTSDSEVITSSKVRRKLAKMTMIFGYSFTVIIVSCVVNVFLSLKESQLQNLWGIGVIIAIATLLLFILKRFKSIKSFFDRIIERLGNKIMFGKASNPIVILDTYGSYVMVEIKLTKLPTQFDNVKLVDSNLKEKYKIQIILIKRNKETLSKIDGETTMCKNDTIVMFGEYKNIRLLFEKPIERVVL